MWTHFDDGFELSVEIGQGVESAFIGYLGDVEIVLKQQLSRMTDPDFIDKARKGLVGPGLEIPTERSGGHVQQVGHILQFYSGRKMLHDVIVHQMHPFGIVGLEDAGVTGARQQVVGFTVRHDL